MFVNGEFVDDEIIRIEAVTLKEQLREQDPSASDLELAVGAQNWSRENLIERTLLRMAAQKDAAPIPAEEIESRLQEHHRRDPRHAQCMLPVDHANLRANVELDLRIERLINLITAKVARPKPREVKDYYHEHKHSFYAPEMVHAAHIVKNVGETTSESDALAAITSIKKLLSEGAEFENTADQLSDCPVLLQPIPCCRTHFQYAG